MGTPGPDGRSLRRQMGRCFFCCFSPLPRAACPSSGLRRPSFGPLDGRACPLCSRGPGRGQGGGGACPRADHHPGPSIRGLVPAPRIQEEPQTASEPTSPLTGADPKTSGRASTQCRTAWLPPRYSRFPRPAASQGRALPSRHHWATSSQRANQTPGRSCMLRTNCSNALTRAARPERRG